MKRQLSELGEKKCRWSNWQRLTAKTYKQIMQLTIKKLTNNPIKKWAENINRHLYTENMHMANKHIIRCSTSLQEIQIKLREMQINSKLQCAIPLHWYVCWFLYLETLLNSLVVTALWWCLYNLFIMYKWYLQTENLFFFYDFDAFYFFFLPDCCG